MLQRTELWQTDREFVKSSGKEWQPTVLSDKWSNDTIRAIIVQGARGGAVGCATELQAGKWRVRFPKVSLEFFIDIILPATLWPLG